jgi:hypothetical protein
VENIPEYLLSTVPETTLHPPTWETNMMLSKTSIGTTERTDNPIDIRSSAKARKLKLPAPAEIMIDWPDVVVDNFGNVTSKPANPADPIIRHPVSFTVSAVDDVMILTPE